jgi:hypothetical protein
MPGLLPREGVLTTVRGLSRVFSTEKLGDAGLVDRLRYCCLSGVLDSLLDSARLDSLVERTGRDQKVYIPSVVA